MDFYDDYEDIERAEIYRLFASIFMYAPDEEAANKLREMFNMAFTDSLIEIAMDFANMFSSRDRHLMPYESLHNYPLGDTPRLWGRAASEVGAFYSSVAIAMDEETNLAPDHISAELLFMSYIIDNRFRIHQKRFLEEHLLIWVPEYCDEIYKHASTNFYKEIANILKEFILSDYEFLGN